ncbi:MAG: outer membrane protein assembly factor BamD, partial [Pseudomonadota bacterium]
MRRFFVTLVCVLALAACNRTPEVPVESRSAQELFLSAERELQEGRSVRAAGLFDEVERLYPFSEWAKRSIIMSAYSYYEAKRFTQARNSAERYLDFYPADDD